MATLDQLLDGQRLERINAEARDIHPGRTLLTIIAAVLYGIGWIARKTFVVLWLILTWSWTAIRLGWQEAGKPPPKR